MPNLKVASFETTLTTGGVGGYFLISNWSEPFLFFGRFNQNAGTKGIWSRIWVVAKQVETETEKAN